MTPVNVGAAESGLASLIKPVQTWQRMHCGA